MRWHNVPGVRQSRRGRARRTRGNRCRFGMRIVATRARQDRRHRRIRSAGRRAGTRASRSIAAYAAPSTMPMAGGWTFTTPRLRTRRALIHATRCCDGPLLARTDPAHLCQHVLRQMRLVGGLARHACRGICTSTSIRAPASTPAANSASAPARRFAPRCRGALLVRCGEHARDVSRSHSRHTVPRKAVAAAASTSRPRAPVGSFVTRATTTDPASRASHFPRASAVRGRSGPARAPTRAITSRSFDTWRNGAIPRELAQLIDAAAGRRRGAGRARNSCDNCAPTRPRCARSTTTARLGIYSHAHRR